MAIRAPYAAVALSVALVVSSCRKPERPATSAPVRLAELLPDDAVGRLTRKTVFFGHQSVGFNLLDGIRDWAAEDPRLRLDIRETADLATLAGPAFAHARIGRNGNPASKIADFTNALRRRGGTRVDVALMKFCYTDFARLEDVPGVFRSYSEALADLRRESPGTTFVHVTTPLTAPVNPAKLFVKDWVKRALGRPTGAGSERAINEFNDLVRKTYLGREPVFDLAAVESTRADGTRVTRRWAGNAVELLAPEYTSDGAHLNEAGRRRAALELLKVLTALPDVPAPR